MNFLFSILSKETNIRKSIIFLVYLPFVVSLLFSIINLRNLNYVNYIFFKYKIKYPQDEIHIYILSFIYFLVFFFVLLFISYKIVKKKNIIFDLKFKIKTVNYYILSIFIFCIVLTIQSCSSFPLKSYIVALEPLIYIHFFTSLVICKKERYNFFAIINIIFFLAYGVYNLSLGITYPMILLIFFVSIFIFYLVLYEKNITFTHITLVVLSFIVVITVFLSREFLRSSNIINGDLFCNTSLDINNQDVVFNKTSNINCDGLADCKVFNYEYLYKFDKQNYLNSKGYKDSNLYYNKGLDYVMSGGSLLDRYDFIKELSNYNLLITKYNIDSLRGSTYYPLLFKYIPRFLIKNKPDEKLGLTIPHYFGLHTYDASHSRTVDIFTESFINFSYFGIIVALIIPFYLFAPFLILNFKKIHFMYILLFIFLTFNSQSNFSLVYGLYFYQLIFLFMYKRIVNK